MSVSFSNPVPQKVKVSKNKLYPNAQNCSPINSWLLISVKLSLVFHNPTLYLVSCFFCNLCPSNQSPLFVAFCIYYTSFRSKIKTKNPTSSKLTIIFSPSIQSKENTLPWKSHLSLSPTILYHPDKPLTCYTASSTSSPLYSSLTSLKPLWQVTNAFHNAKADILFCPRPHYNIWHGTHSFLWELIFHLASVIPLFLLILKSDNNVLFFPCALLLMVFGFYMVTTSHFPYSPCVISIIHDFNYYVYGNNT